MPALHGVHTVELELLNVPRAQGLHVEEAVAPSVFEKVPGRQAVQLVESLKARKVPFGQFAPVHFDEPAAETYPTAQPAHVTDVMAAETREKVPLAHMVHATALNWDW